MSINRGMDKEDVVHIDNGVLLSHDKKQGVNITVHNSQNMETTCVYGQMNE